MKHELKCEQEFYQAQVRGEKLFELRKNDRNFMCGDEVILHETDCGIYTGRSFDAGKITYILFGGVYGLDKNYCILQLQRKPA